MKSSKLMLVFGVLLPILAVLMSIGSFTDPSRHLLINISYLVTGISWFAFGIVLILVYLKRKQKEEAGQFNEIVTDSIDDQKVLVKKQSIIFAYFIFITSIISSEFWILNDYTKMSINNFLMISDSLISLVLMYLVVKLIQGKFDQKKFLYVIIFYSVVLAIFEAIKSDWYFALAQLLPIIFFWYGIKEPVSRKKYRVSNYVVLPVIVLSMLVLGYIGDYSFSKMLKDEAKAEQAYLNANTDQNSAVNYLMQQEKPTREDAKNLYDKAVFTNEKIVQVKDLISVLQKEYKKKATSIQQINGLQSAVNSLEVFDVYFNQNIKIQEFAKYLMTINLNNITEAQRVKIGSYVREIEDFNKQSRDLYLEFPDRF